MSICRGHDSLDIIPKSLPKNYTEKVTSARLQKMSIYVLLK